MLAALRIVKTENPSVRRIDMESSLRIAMRARMEGRLEGVLPVDSGRLRNLTAGQRPRAKVERWDTEIAVNGQSLLALSSSTIASVSNLKEFAPVLRTIALQILDLVGDGPNEAGEYVAFAVNELSALTSAQRQ